MNDFHKPYESRKDESIYDWDSKPVQMNETGECGLAFTKGEHTVVMTSKPYWNVKYNTNPTQEEVLSRRDYQEILLARMAGGASMPTSNGCVCARWICCSTS